MKSWSESEHLEHHHSVRLMAEFTYLSKPDLPSPCLFCESLSHQFLSYSYSTLTQSLIFHPLSCDFSLCVCHTRTNNIPYFLSFPRSVIFPVFNRSISMGIFKHTQNRFVGKKTQQNFCELFDWALYVSHLYLLNALDHLSLELSQSQ